MDISKIKNILKDKVKTAYVAAFALLALLAFILIGKHDIGNFFRLSGESREAEHNLTTLKRSADYKIFLSDFKKQFAAGNGTGWLMEVVTDFARKDNVAIEFLRPWDTNFIRGTRVIRVMAEGRAPYANMMRFLGRLENYEKFLYVEDLSITAEGTRRLPGRMPRIPGYTETGAGGSMPPAMSRMQQMTARRGRPPMPGMGPAGAGMPPFPQGGPGGADMSQGPEMPPPAGMEPMPEELVSEQPANPEERIGKFKMVIAAFNVEK